MRALSASVVGNEVMKAARYRTEQPPHHQIGGTAEVQHARAAPRRTRLCDGPSSSRAYAYTRKRKLGGHREACSTARRPSTELTPPCPCAAHRARSVTACARVARAIRSHGPPQIRFPRRAEGAISLRAPSPLNIGLRARLVRGRVRVRRMCEPREGWLRPGLDLRPHVGREHGHQLALAPRYRLLALPLSPSPRSIVGWL